MSHFIQNIHKFLNVDWKQEIIKSWNKIPSLDKRSFLWIFGMTNLVFLWHTITFFFGNHDWGQIKYGVPVKWSLFDGRWGAGVIQQLMGGDILPVWNNLFCFAGFTLAVILLAKYWKVPKNVFTYAIFGLFIILMPYTPPWLQFVRSETHFWNIFLIVGALTLSVHNKWWGHAIAFLLLYFCLGCYAAMLPAMIIIFLGRCVLDVWFEHKTFIQLIKQRWQTAGVIIMAFVAFAITFLLMKKYNIIIPMMTVDNVGIETLFNNLIHIGTGIKDSFFKALPYIPTGFKVLLGLAIPMVLWLIKQQGIKRIALLFFLFVGIIIATQTTNLLSAADYSNQLRIDFFAMPYAYALFWGILLRTGKVWENLALLFMTIAVFYSGLQDVRDQKVKHFDRLRDIQIFEDIVARIKANPQFNPDKRYNLLILGEVEKNNELTTFDKYNSRLDWPNAWSPFIPNWNAKDYFDFYEKESFIDKNFSDSSSPHYLPLTDVALLEMDINFLLNQAAPWPQPNSVHVDEEHIYIIFQQEELDKLKERLKAFSRDIVK